MSEIQAGRAAISGEAGRKGEDVRSDLHVRVEPRESGGIELQLASKVEVYYGDALRAQILDVARAAGLASGRIVVTDAGALPFVVASRVEAAVRAAGIQ